MDVISSKAVLVSPTASSTGRLIDSRRILGSTVDNITKRDSWDKTSRLDDFVSVDPLLERSGSLDIGCRII